MRVRLFSSSGFVIEEMEVAVANLKKVNVAGDNGRATWKGHLASSPFLCHSSERIYTYR